MGDNEVADRITAARKGAGFRSRRAATDEFDWPFDTYVSHEMGRRNPNRSTLRKYASAFGVTLNWLLTGLGDTPRQSDQSELSETQTGSTLSANRLPIIGGVQGGAFMEAWPAMAEPFETLPVVPDEKYPESKQYLLEVRGPSMNMKFPDGSFAHCVEISYKPGTRMPEPGTFVIVERHKAGLIEVTIKELRLNAEGQYELWPRSTDPAWKAPIVLNDGSGVDEVSIKGIVVGCYTKMT